MRIGIHVNFAIRLVVQNKAKADTSRKLAGYLIPVREYKRDTRPSDLNVIQEGPYRLYKRYCC